MTDYFSDREHGPRPRTADDVMPAAWGGIVQAIQSRVADGSFGVHFPETCPDTPNPPVGTNWAGFGLALRGEVDVDWPLDAHRVPDPLTIMDLVEFCFRHVAMPSRLGRYHDWMGGHYHLQFDEEPGRQLFQNDVNRIFSRNGLAYELRRDGQVVRLAPAGLRETLTSTLFRTGDAALDGLLESARAKFLSPSFDTRNEGLERLWDAWERLKTVEPAANKAASTHALLDRAASEPNLRALIENDARQLTDAGNAFQIRHHETNKAPIASSEQTDYFFNRLFGLIRFLLRTTGRGR